MIAIDVALGDGTSAALLSQTVRKLLNNSTALFRRVRDKNGQLRLSQNAKNVSSTTFAMSLLVYIPKTLNLLVGTRSADALLYPNSQI